MTTYRMIAIDLDGTLLSPTSTVTPRTKAAIHKALSAGMLICFATGRNHTESRAILDAVAHYPTAVFVGGAVVIDTDKKETLHRTMMAPRLAQEVCREIESMGHVALALQDTHPEGIDYLVTAAGELDPVTARWMKETRAQVRTVPSLGDFNHEHTMRVGIVAEGEAILAMKEMVARRFGERVACHSVRVPAYNLEVLEVFDPAVNKWAGILHVAARHGVEAKEIIAIGDDVNDVPMIKNAGLGVAMGNARPEAIAVAQRVIGRNSDEGLAEFLEELVAQHIVSPSV